MYTIRISRLSTLPHFGWHVRCSAGMIIARSVTKYKTYNHAKRWAKYWAIKLSFESFEFKGIKNETTT